MTTPWKLPHAHPAIPGGGKVLTPADREFHHYSHPGVWGALADEQMHNPFRDFDFEDRGRDSADDEDRIYHGWDHAADAHPGYVKDFHERYAHHVAKAHPVMAIPSSVVPQIMKEGRIKSQFETGASEGEYDPEGRAMVEHHQFGYPEGHPERARPIYGYLSGNPFTDSSGAGYGHTTFALHKPHVWHRTTFSGDDSWGGMGKVSPVSVGDYAADPHSYRHAVPINHLGFDTEEAHRLAGHSLARRMEERTPKERADAFWRGTERDRDHFPYPEAQYHGGVDLHAVRYAVVRSPDTGGDPHAMAASSREATRALTAAGIPWVHITGHSSAGPEHAVAWDDGRTRRHKGALMAAHAAIAAGAFHAGHRADVRWHQGDTRYLIELDAPGARGLPMGQVADIEWGRLYQPQLVDSVLARGYWEMLEHPVDAADVLARVRPVG